MTKFQRLSEDQVRALIGKIEQGTEVKITITQPTFRTALLRTASANQWFSVLMAFLGGAAIGVAIYLAVQG